AGHRVPGQGRGAVPGTVLVGEGEGGAGGGARIDPVEQPGVLTERHGTRVGHVHGREVLVVPGVAGGEDLVRVVVHQLVVAAVVDVPLPVGAGEDRAGGGGGGPPVSPGEAGVEGLVHRLVDGRRLAGGGAGQRMPELADDRRRPGGRGAVADGAEVGGVLAVGGVAPHQDAGDGLLVVEVGVEDIAGAERARVQQTA